MTAVKILEDRGFQLKRKTANEYATRCPFCGGIDRLCVWPEENRYWCRQCEAKGDDIQLLRDLEGMSFKEAAEAVGRGDNGGRLQVKPTKKPKKPFVHPELGRPDAIYNYIDENGKPLFHVCRFNPKSEGEEKTFRQCKTDGIIWTVKDVQLVLYNLPELIKAQDVLYVEGEKDAEALKRLGFVATTNPMGAGKLPDQQEKHGILQPLKGKRVFIFPDNDEPGKKHAEQLATLVHGKAKEIRIVELPGVPEHGDVSDFIEKEGEEAKTKLIELTANTPAWTPPKNFFSAEDLLSITYEKRPPIIGAGIMPYGSHILISGETGVGKSLLRLELATHLVMGWDWLGFEISTSRKVAIFQYENSEPMEQTRLKRMCQGLGIQQLPKGKLVYVDRKNRLNLTLKKDREKLLNLVKECGSEVIVYDCLSNLHSSKENDNIQMRDVLDSLTEINAILGTSCIVIHHFGKPSEGQATVYRTRGASSIVDWAVTAMAFTVKPHEHKTIRQLEFIKVRDGAVPKPVLLERDENFLLNITDEDTLCPPGRVKEILEDLGGSVDTQRPLVDAIIRDVNCTGRSARRYLKRAIELKVIQEINQGQGKPKGYYVEK